MRTCIAGIAFIVICANSLQIVYSQDCYNWSTVQGVDSHNGGGSQFSDSNGFLGAFVHTLADNVYSGDPGDPPREFYCKASFYDAETNTYITGSTAMVTLNWNQTQFIDFYPECPVSALIGVNTVEMIVTCGYYDQNTPIELEQVSRGYWTRDE